MTVSEKLPDQMTRDELLAEIEFWRVRVNRKRKIDEEHEMMVGWIELLKAYL